MANQQQDPKKTKRQAENAFTNLGKVLTSPTAMSIYSHSAAFAAGVGATLAYQKYYGGMVPEQADVDVDMELEAAE